MKVTELLNEALGPDGRVKGGWKIQNMSGVMKNFKDEQSPEAKAWMKNRGDQNQVWDKATGHWTVTASREEREERKLQRQDEREERQREKEKVGKHLKQTDFAKIYNHWVTTIGDSFPDGDPMDLFADWFEDEFPEISKYHMTDILDTALRKCGSGHERKGHYEYMKSMWEEHALGVLFDIYQDIKDGMTLDKAIDNASLGDHFFSTEKGNLVMHDNPWGKVDRSKYVKEWKKDYPKLVDPKV